MVTLPIGVLQSGDVTITPPLPDTHQRVLGVLASNAFEKVVLRFPEKFWDAGVYGIRQFGDEGSGGTPGTTWAVSTTRRRC